MRVPLELRSTERTQLDEMIPNAIDRLREVGLDEEADELEDIDILSETNGKYYAEATEWASVISALRVLRDQEGLRSWWLRTKLARRLSETMEELEADDQDATPGVDVEESGMQTESTA